MATQRRPRVITGRARLNQNSRQTKQSAEPIHKHKGKRLAIVLVTVVAIILLGVLALFGKDLFVGQAISLLPQDLSAREAGIPLETGEAGIPLETGVSLDVGEIGSFVVVANIGGYDGDSYAYELEYNREQLEFVTADLTAIQSNYIDLDEVKHEVNPRTIYGKVMVLGFVKAPSFTKSASVPAGDPKTKNTYALGRLRFKALKPGKATLKFTSFEIPNIKPLTDIGLGVNIILKTRNPEFTIEGAEVTPASCSKANPELCTTHIACFNADNFWNLIDEKCYASCPEGTGEVEDLACDLLADDQMLPAGECPTGFIKKPSADCQTKPDGSICLGFPDGYNLIVFEGKEKEYTSELDGITYYQIKGGVGGYGHLHGTNCVNLAVGKDTDNDLVPDKIDNCPAVANADQADANKDGVGDACTKSVSCIGDVPSEGILCPGDSEDVSEGTYTNGVTSHAACTEYKCEFYCKKGYQLLSNNKCVLNEQTTLLGDVNGDGKVSNIDAILILKHGVELITLTAEQQTAGDVNFCQTGQKGVTNVDAILILQLGVGLIDNLPCANEPA